MQPATPRRQPPGGLLSLDLLRRMCYNCHVRRCRPWSCCISCCSPFYCCLTLQSFKNNNLAPHGSRCAGFFFALGVFRGLFCHMPYCHFNAAVRRFNVWGYPYTAAVPLVLYPLFVALWRGVVSCSAACRLRCQLAAVLVPLWPCRWPSEAPAVVTGAVASGGCFAVRGAPPKSPA